MSMPATLTRRGRTPSEFLPDTGCAYSPTCAGCPWRACYWTMPPDERRIFRLAFRTLQTFKAAPDRALVD
jgi:hypothetical protein